ASAVLNNVAARARISSTSVCWKELPFGLAVALKAARTNLAQPPSLFDPAPVLGQVTGGESVEIKISARHGHLSEETQQFIREKAQKLLRLFDRLTMIAVTVDLKDEVNKVVEFLVSAEHKHDFVARETNTDILAAVDLVLAKLEQQLRKYKEK